MIWLGVAEQVFVLQAAADGYQAWTSDDPAADATNR